VNIEIDFFGAHSRSARAPDSAGVDSVPHVSVRHAWDA
jgi:hypothetical protein